MGFNMTGKRWSDEELEKLRQIYGKVPYEIVKASFDRHRASIWRKAKQLGLKHNYHRIWTEEQLKTLEEEYGRVPIDTLREKLGKSRKQIYTKAIGIGLTNRGRPTPMPTYWTEEMDKIIIENWERKTYPEIANILGLETIQVKSRARKLGIRKDPNMLPAPDFIDEWSIEERAYLAGLIDGDGSITFRRRIEQNTIIVSLMFGNTHMETVLWVAKRFGDKCVYIIPHKREYFSVYLNRRNHVEAALKALLPYLITKKEKAKAVLRIIELLNDRRKGDPMPLEAWELCDFIQKRQLHPGRVAVGI